MTSRVLIAAVLLAGASGCSPPEPEPAGSIVLIVVDTLRADRMGLYGHARPTTPGLDAWVPEARVYTNAIATSPWTLPSFGSILTGELPLSHEAGAPSGERPSELDEEVKWARPLEPTVPTLAEALNGAGYRTAAIVNNSWLLPHLGLDRGFQHYDAQRANQRRHRDAAETVDAALEWIDGNRQQPFFLLVHFFDPHLRYGAPEPFRGRFTDEQPVQMKLPIAGLKRLREEAPTMPPGRQQFIRAAYDEEIAYVDGELDRFFGALRQSGAWDELTVIVTSDHGEELFDHGGFEHGHAVHQELLRVPLLFWGPQVRAGHEETAVSLLDLFDTVLTAAGNEPAEDSSAEGFSLWQNATTGAPLPKRTLFAQNTLTGPDRSVALRWPYKLIVTDSRPPELYDLEEDPGERVDVASSHPSIVAELQAELAELPPLAPDEGVELSEEMLEDLRSLGYLD